MNDTGFEQIFFAIIALIAIIMNSAVNGLIITAGIYAVRILILKNHAPIKKIFTTAITYLFVILGLQMTIPPPNQTETDRVIMLFTDLHSAIAICFLSDPLGNFLNRRSSS